MEPSGLPHRCPTADARCAAALPPVLRTLYPQGMSPGSPVYVACIIWVVAFHTGEICDCIGAPKALGMMLVGVLMRSTPPPPGHDALLTGLSRGWSRNIRAGAMALVFLRAGMGLNFSTIRAYGLNFLSFVTLPSIVESLACALVGRALFSMPFLFAWSMSWMTSAVGPGALTSGCASVKERGYAPRAPNFLQTCACFDDAVCIVGCVPACVRFLTSHDCGQLTPRCILSLLFSKTASIWRCIPSWLTLTSPAPTSGTLKPCCWR